MTHANTDNSPESSPSSTLSTLSTPHGKSEYQTITPDRGRWLRFFIPMALFILVTDLWSKSAVFAHATSSLHPQALPGVEFPVWIVPAWNTGVAWSMFDSMPMLIAIMTAFLLPILFFVYLRNYCNKHILVDIAFGSVLGGACANAYDRFMAQFSDSFYGVRDFIYVHLPVINYDWPIFNIADAGISCGFVILLIASYLQKSPVKEVSITNNTDTLDNTASQTKNALKSKNAP